MQAQLSTTAKPNVGSPPPRHGIDEKNFAFFPFSVLDRQPKGSDIIEYQAHDLASDGTTILRKVSIEGSPKDGLPNAQDEDVLLGLIYLTYLSWEAALARFPDRDPDPRVFFTLHQLLLAIRWPCTQKYYQRVRKAIARWAKMRITYENWCDAHDKYRHERGFTLLDNYDLNADSRRRPASESQLELPLFDGLLPRQRCSITWGRVFYDNLRHRYIKPLDLEQYFALPTPAAKRAYRFLDHDLPAPGQPRWYDLECFAYHHVGFQRGYKPSALRAKVKASVVKPLEEAQFIDTESRDDRRFAKQAGAIRVVFSRKNPSPAFSAADPVPTPLPASSAVAPTARNSPDPAAAALIKELTDRKLGGKAARELVAAYPAEYIRQKLDYFDCESERGNIKKPAAWLRKAIVDDYGEPADYLPRRERERQRQAAEERQRQADQTKRQQQEEHAAELLRQQRDQAEKAHVAAYLKTLTPQEHKALEEQAIARADDKAREHTTGSDTLSKIALRMLVYREVLRIHPLPEPPLAS
jgi:hypothetical protein